MTPDELYYRERLFQFNRSEKYLLEMEFLYRLLSVSEKDIILDYGCGVGSMIDYLSKRTSAKIFGYDVVNYLGNNRTINFLSKVDGVYDKIYFLHSIAHIPNLKEVLEGLIKSNLATRGELIVITPNLNFDLSYKRLHNIPYENKTDRTVVGHFTLDAIKVLFEELELKIVSAGLVGENLEDHPERIFIIGGKN